MSFVVSMAAFALASSISPGPVNLVALSSAVRFGVGVSLRYVSGATVGFTVLLVLIGLGLHEVLLWLPWLTAGIQLAGVAFLLYMAWGLARDDGRLQVDGRVRAPSFVHGAVMQWLNPKAWMASLAGMGAFAADGATARVLQFAAIYFVVCYLSLACWSCAGGLLRQQLRDAPRVRLFNRCMAGLLAGSAVYLLVMVG